MPKELMAAYDTLAHTYDQNRGLFDMTDVFDDFFKVLDPTPGHVLDLGCGAGEPIPGMFIRRGWQVTGVDFSENMLKLAEKYQPAMKRIFSDIMALEQEEGAYDAVTAVYSLFHIEKEYHPRLFSNIYRWLKPGGKALFTYATKAYTGADSFSGHIEFMSVSLFYSHTTPEALQQMLLDVDFDIVAMDYRDIGGETFLWATVGKPAIKYKSFPGRDLL